MNPVLYIFMRSDLDSLNPGKGMAQACHAANMAQELAQLGSSEMKALWKLWCADRMFGTTIVLDAPLWKINFIKMLKPQKGFISGVVTDPTYPIRDGEQTHLVVLDTCAFVFGDADFIRPLTAGHQLYK